MKKGVRMRRRRRENVEEKQNTMKINYCFNFYSFSLILLMLLFNRQFCSTLNISHDIPLGARIRERLLKFLPLTQVR